MFFSRAHPEEADGGAGEVVAVGFELVDDHAPGEGAGDEDAAVGGEDAPEVGVGLEGGDEAVGAEGDDPRPDPDQARCSRTPCQISQAPPISATTKRAIERKTSTTRGRYGPSRAQDEFRPDGRQAGASKPPAPEAP